MITNVRGLGLLVVIEFNGDISQSVLNDCIENGMLVNNIKPNAIRFMPALTIDESEINYALNILDKVLSNHKK